MTGGIPFRTEKAQVSDAKEAFNLRFRGQPASTGVDTRKVGLKWDDRTYRRSMYRVLERFQVKNIEPQVKSVMPEDITGLTCRADMFPQVEAPRTKRPGPHLSQTPWLCLR
jgi:hypothetical protein